MNERIVVVGLPGSGKTYWCKAYLKRWITANPGKGALIVDVMSEYTGKGSIYRPADRTEPREEIEGLVQTALIDPYIDKKKKRYHLVLFDEASRYIFPRISLGPQFGYLNDFSRHMDLTMICVARRFSQVHTDISELAHKLVIFSQTGKNDLERLAQIAEGLDDAVRGLKGHEHIEYSRGEIVKKL